MLPLSAAGRDGNEAAGKKAGGCQWGAALQPGHPAQDSSFGNHAGRCYTNMARKNKNKYPRARKVLVTSFLPSRSKPDDGFISTTAEFLTKLVWHFGIVRLFSYPTSGRLETLRFVF